VSVVHSDNEGQIKGLMDVMDNTDCVVIAGGDGSLSEVVLLKIKIKELRIKKTIYRV